MKKKVLFIVSSAGHIGPHKRHTGNFLTETAHPFQTLLEAGYEIDIASIKGGAAPLDDMVSKDEALNAAFLAGEGFARMMDTFPVEDADPSLYDAVFVPGGLAPMADMPQNETVHKIIAKFWESGKVVAAVCHGPVSLLNVKLSDGSWLVDGKKITSFSNEEEENYAKADVPFMLESALREHGAKFTSVAPWQPYSITDGRLITGQNPASALGVGKRMVEVLDAQK